MKKRLLFRFFAFCVMLSVLSVSAMAAGTTPYPSSNIHSQDYQLCARPVFSYLYANENDGLTRIEYLENTNTVLVEDYNHHFTLEYARTIPMELPIWGGFYAGKDHHYFIFGQTNEAEDDSREVLRVVKYSKAWVRLGAASLYGANTTVPFEAGSLRCAEYDGMLYIHTAHEMYAVDEIHHQANLSIAVREKDMTVTDSYHIVSNMTYGYVSHSFNQFVLTDQEHNIVTIDQGDSHPCSVVLMRYASAKAGGEQFSGRVNSSTVQDLESPSIRIVKEVSVGGFAETAKGYITAYNCTGDSYYGPRDIYLGYTDKTSLTTTTIRLTVNADSLTPVLAPNGLCGGYILWEEADSLGTIRYAAYDSEGNVGATLTVQGSLSDCQPICYKGKLIWYVTGSMERNSNLGTTSAEPSSPVFYFLDDKTLITVDGTNLVLEVVSQPAEAEQEDLVCWLARYNQWGKFLGLKPLDRTSTSANALFIGTIPQESFKLFVVDRSSSHAPVAAPFGT